MAYSLNNFILTVSIAHYASVAQFGTYSLLLASYLIGCAVSRGFCAETLTIGFSVADMPTLRSACYERVKAAALFGCACGVVLGLGTLLVLPSSVRGLCLAFAVGFPLLFVQDVVRFTALAAGAPSKALANDLAALTLQIALTVVSVSTGTAHPPVFAVIWVVASAFGTIVGAWRLRLRLASAVRARMTSINWKFGFQLAADNLATQGAQQSTAYIVVGAAGLSAAAGLRAAQTVLTPPSVVCYGAQSAAVPEMVRELQTSARRMLRTVLIICGALVSLTALYLVVILAFPQQIGTALFGQSWASARSLVIPVGLGQIAGAFATPAVGGLRALADARRTLLSRGFAVVTWPSAVVPGAMLDGARGASIGIASAAAAQAVVWWVSFSRSYVERVRNVDPIAGRKYPLSLASDMPVDRAVYPSRHRGRRTDDRHRSIEVMRDES